jgi:exodeoxyribonuclease VII large subunit
MRLAQLAQQRFFRRPFQLVQDRSRRVDELELRSTRAIQRQLARAKDRVAALAGRLDSLSPLAVLSRGYSLTYRTGDGQLVRDAATLSVGQQITSRLERGQVISRVEQIDAPNQQPVRSDITRITEKRCADGTD